MFASAFLAATVVPFASEITLAAALAAASPAGASVIVFEETFDGYDHPGQTWVGSDRGRSRSSVVEFLPSFVRSFSNCRCAGCRRRS